VECNLCVNLRYQCPGGGRLVEVVVEQFEQTSITTARSPTTLRWLFNEWIPKQKFDYVIGNIGLHELDDIQKHGGVDQFTAQASRFAGLVSEAAGGPAGPKFTYVLTTDASDDYYKEYAALTNSYHIKILNDIVKAQMERIKVPLADAFSVSRYHGSLHALHSDRVHMHQKNDLYYRQMALAVLTTL
ncbi:unnamed protein product, partial [Polarella glacialis]